jgi:hypothetical protein
MKGRKTIATDLVGAMFERKNEMTWPTRFQANAAGEYLATVDAAYLDKDGSVQVLAHDPFGNVGTFWPEHHKFVRGAKERARQAR